MKKYLKMHQHDEIDRLWEKIKNSVVKRDMVLYSLYAAAVANQGDIQKMHDMLQEMRNEGVEPDVPLLNRVLDCYVKNGNLDEMLKFFRKTFPQPRDTSYIRLLDACAQQKQVQLAFTLYYEMCEKYRLQPRILHFEKLLNACVNANALFRGFDVLSELSKHNQILLTRRFVLGSFSDFVVHILPSLVTDKNDELKKKAISLLRSLERETKIDRKYASTPKVRENVLGLWYELRHRYFDLLQQNPSQFQSSPVIMSPPIQRQ